MYHGVIYNAGADRTGVRIGDEAGSENEKEPQRGQTCSGGDAMGSRKEGTERLNRGVGHLLEKFR